MNDKSDNYKRMNEIKNKINSLDFLFQEIQGCVFLLIDGEKYTEEHASEAIDFSRGKKQQAEKDCNRFFLYRDFIDLHHQDETFTEMELVEIAKIFASILQNKLMDAFPEKTFSIDIIGDQLVDIEPLELCVTFWTEK